MKSLRPVLFLTFVLLIVGLACSALTGGGSPAPTQPPATAVPVQPTNPPTAEPPQPTEAPVTEAPVATATEVPAQAQDFFTEEFDQDPGDNWQVDILGKGAEAYKDTVKTSFENSRMRVEIPNDNLYFYYTYVGQSYDNVRIDLRAENRGVNFNNVSLTCRISDDGWYEWSVRSDGLWDLYAVTDEYHPLTNGGVNFLKQGKDVNEYAMICKDKQISMFINGRELKQSPFTETKYGLREGTVGFNISSLNRKILPVIVEVDWFKISQP
jgi:hypothetical protein